MSLATTYTVHSRRHIAAALLLTVFLLLVLELLVRHILLPSSRVERRVTAELYAAMHVRPAQPPTVLVAGNSLLLQGISMDLLQQADRDVAALSRVVVEQTSYWDWWFGLRYLAARGARPDVVVLMLAPQHFLSNAARGEYTSMRMVRLDDAVEFGRVLGLHPTDISKLALSNVSVLYGFRGEYRKVLIGNLIRDLPVLMQRLAVPRRPALGDSVVAERIKQRLGALRREADAQGLRVVFAFPPTLDYQESEVASRAARAAGIPVIVPKDFRSYRDSDFSDGFHLGPEGARRFTAEFAGSLRQLVDSLRLSDR